MDARSTRRQARSPVRWGRWLPVVAVLACGTGCSSIIKAVTGWDVPVYGEDGVGERPRTVYLQGPVPGWELEVLQFAPFSTPPSLFQADLFAGACPGLNLAAAGSDESFGLGGIEAGFEFFDLAPSHAADINYYQPGRVTLAAVTGPGPMAPFARMQAFGAGGGACTSVGIPLLTLGTPVQYRVLR